MTSKPLPPDKSDEAQVPGTKKKLTPRRLTKGDGMNIGLTVGATMVVFVVGGNWLDQKLNTDPWLTLIGAVFALTSIIVYLLRIGAR